MATSSKIKKPVAAEKLPFDWINPVVDPAPDLLNSFLSKDALREHLASQLQAQIDMMKVQTDFAARSLVLLKKGK